MNTLRNLRALRFAALASFAALSAAGAHAEAYQGVLQIASRAPRAEVQAQAVAAAHRPDPYAEGAGASIAQAVPGVLERAAVRAQAVATAHAPNQNLKREAFVGSTVPSSYAMSVPTTRQAGL